MTFRILLVATLIATAFTRGFIQDDEDRQGAASSHPLNHEFHDHDSVNKGDDSGSESELRRKPRGVLQCPNDSSPKSCEDGETLACFCDTIQQCPNGEDEANCDAACPNGQALCGDEDTCIYLEQICDGYPDCANKWDESICDTTTSPIPSTTTPTTTTTPGPNTTSPDPPTTTTARLQCAENSTSKPCENGTTFACFCDSNEECPDGEDEKEENCFSDSQASDSQASDPPVSDSLSGGAIAGIIIAVLAVTAVVIGVARFKKLI